MHVRELSIADAYEFAPVQHRDDRGTFLEWYRADVLENTVGHALALRQGNVSVSRRGVVRGIHFAGLPGQAKYVTALAGSVIDFIVDVRVGSPTFGKWDSVLLDDVDRRAVYLSEGLGHAFVSLTDEAVVSYLVTDVYRPANEFGINPLDPDVGLRFPDDVGEPLLSPKDVAAPLLAQAREQNILPNFADAQALYAELSKGNN